jgi:hypothetical protein
VLKTSFAVKECIFGGITINTRPQFHDYVEGRNFEVIELHYLKPLTSELMLQEDVFKVLRKSVKKPKSKIA